MKNSQGFTLVELIVVITILAILGTIGFISLSGYSRDARNSKKLTEVNSIVKTIDLEVSVGGNVMSFISNDSNTIEGIGLKIGGYSSSEEFQGAYQAGDIDYDLLKISKESTYDEDFLSSYKLGATTHGGYSQYEVAATIEQETDLDTIIKGNWVPRTSSSTNAERDVIVGDTFYLSGSKSDNLGLKIGDLVGVGSSTGVILGFPNSNSIQLEEVIVGNGENIFLKTDESVHLIQKWSSSEYPIDEGKGRSFVPYIK